MSLDLIIRPEAEADMTEAFDWYEERDLGLGSEFLRSIDAIFGSITRNPLQYPIVHRSLRKAVARRFPYQVFYTVEKHGVLVVAVFHARRDPRLWQERA